MAERKYVSFLFIGLMMVITSNGWTNCLTSSFCKSEQEARFIQALEEAKAELQAGVNAWDVDLLKKGRDLFLNLFIQTKEKNAHLYYYVALADYRLATYYLSVNNREETERCVSEGQRYLDEAIKLDPSMGELFALYSVFLGYEIALYPERGMSLGPRSSECLATALAKEPENPRINLINGLSLFYTPEAYGGGVDKGIESLEKAVELFEKEKIKDALKPSWGKEEAYTFLARAYIQKKEYERAKKLLKKALEINPEFSFAKETLQSLAKEIK